jgi:hypothetical protein
MAMGALAIGFAALSLSVSPRSSAIAADEKGLSIEDAIVLSGVSGELDGVAAEHGYTDTRYHGWIWRTQALLQSGGRIYDVIDIAGPGGEAKSIYFDMTDWFGKMQ